MSTISQMTQFSSSFSFIIHCPTRLNAVVNASKIGKVASLVDKAECLGRLRLGMSKTLVTNLLGPPTETLGNGSVFRYDDRYLKFDSKDLLIGITEARPQ